MPGPEYWLRESLRRLALPVAAEREPLVLGHAAVEMSRVGIALADGPAWLDDESGAWEATGSASRGFQRVVRASLRAGDETEIGARLGQSYFALHRALLQHHLFDHRHAVNLLSQARLAAVLARDENLSAAMIASVLQSRDARTPLSWSIVDVVLSGLGFHRSLTLEMMHELLDRDAETEPEVFGDATFAECAALLGEAGRRAHFPHDLEREAHALFPLSADGGEPLWTQRGGHLAMLHFSAAQVEHWDHRVSAIYEFSPRGQAADEVARRFREAGAYHASQNMFLNNAKSAGRIDRDWAWTKGPAEAASAHALANVVDGLDALAFPPRRHIAGLLRAWLTRIVRVAAGSQVTLPAEISEDDARALAAAIASAATETRGVLEQRLVDAVGKAVHGDVVSRGVGDPVNASNVSRVKLGDCEFQVGQRQLVAYEPHAGSLSQVYVEAHDRSIGQVIPRRLAAWAEAAATRGRWAVEVVLVAHGVSDDVELPQPRVEVDSSETAAVEISYRVTTYGELVQEARATSLAQPMARYVLAPLNQPHVPDVVKRAVLDRLP